MVYCICLVDVIFSEAVDDISSENAGNYGINNGVTVLSARLESDLKTVKLTTTSHAANVQYVLEINNVKDRAYPPNTILPNSTYEYIYSPTDLTAPFIQEVRTVDGNHVEILFSENIEKNSAETVSNYHISNGIGIFNAALDIDQKTLHLTTTSHTNGETYILTVNNIRDVSCTS